MLSVFALAAAVTVDDSVIELSADTVWPKTVQKGFWPMQVEVRNISSKPQSLTLTVGTGGFSMGKTWMSLELDPRESRSLEIMVPSWLPSTGSTVSVDRAGASPLRTPTIGPRTTGVSCLIATNLVVDSPCEATTPEKLPSNYIAYTSLASLIVDYRGSWESARLEPIAAWVRQGGTLMVIDPDENLAQHPSFSPWLTERYQQDRRYWMGLGEVIYLPSPAHIESYLSQIDPLVGEDYGKDTFLPFSVVSIPGIGEAPVGAFAILLLGTLIALGPFNYYLVRRMGRPESWLVTTPILSLGATLLVGTYGALQGGFEILATTRALGFLDQKLHTLEIVETRTTWSGASPPSYLNIPDGTWHFPIGAGEDLSYNLNITDQRKLDGGFMGVRLMESHKVVHSMTLRGRLQIDGEQVTNQLGYAIKELYYRSPDDTWYSASNLGDGARQTLKDASASLIFDQAREEWPGPDIYGKIPLNGYMAWIEPPGFLPQDDINLVYKDGLVVLLGALEE